MNAADLTREERIRLRALARMFMDEVPRTPNQRVPADQLALVVLLSAGPMNMSAIAEALGLSQAAASTLVKRAFEAGRVDARWRRDTSIPRWSKHWRRIDGEDGRETIVSLSARGRRERSLRRGRQITSPGSGT